MDNWNEHIFRFWLRPGFQAALKKILPKAKEGPCVEGLGEPVPRLSLVMVQGQSVSGTASPDCRPNPPKHPSPFLGSRIRQSQIGRVWD